MIDAAIVGLGRWGRTLVEAVQGKSDKIRFTRAVSRDPSQHRDFLETQHVLADSSLAEVLADRSIKAVVLATPHSRHVEEVVAVAAAGKAVFCEKPLALTKEGAARAVAACRDAGVVLGIGTDKRYFPAIAEVIRLADSGELGRLIHVEGNFSNEVAAGFTAWRESLEESPAGGMTGTGIHVLDALARIAGPVRRTHTQLLYLKPGPDPWDSLSVMLEFASGVGGTLAAVRSTPTFLRVHAFGRNGSAEAVSRNDVIIRKSGAEPIRIKLQGLDSVRINLEHFADAVAGVAPFPVSPEQILNVTNAFVAIADTVRTGVVTQEVYSVPETLPYGAWKSPITSDLIVAETIGLGAVLVDGGDIYWTESRPGEGGRNVLVKKDRGDVTPAPFNVRTRVHEYGGGAALVHQGAVWFSHFADQRLYRLEPGGTPQPLTPEAAGGASFRYADGVIDTVRGRWVGVREAHGPDHRVDNAIVAVDPAMPGAGRVLAEGADFYAAPRVSPDGKRLAWVEWNHPNMPWVCTELWVAEFAGDGGLGERRKIAGGADESVCQPQWSPDGVLYLISDRNGWWNLYRCDAGGDGIVRPVCPHAAEFAPAQWVFGQSSYAFLSAEQMACAYGESGRTVLARLDIASGRLTPLVLPFTEFGSVKTCGEKIVCGTGSPVGPGAIVTIDPETSATEVLRQSSAAAADPDLQRYFIAARHLEFATENGLTAFANYYAPHNPDFTAPAGEAPPLVVKCHGGPTSSASSSLSMGIQYWTSRGIAVIDVDYGGSTGYGRAYRDRLKGTWGVIDVDDCVNAARHVAAEGLADSERMVITGGSAGGYTVLAALACRDVFKGGASYYGVSDVAALARDTHKFESRYLDWLIGPYPQEEALYRERSPLTHADKLDCPVIFFQGADDRVVPPNQTEMMVEALRRRGIPCGYLLFAGEQHGFRRAENIKRALDAELYFYAELVFKTRLSF